MRCYLKDSGYTAVRRGAEGAQRCVAYQRWGLVQVNDAACYLKHSGYTAGRRWKEGLRPGESSHKVALSQAWPLTPTLSPEGRGS